MSYDVKLRERALAYWANGHTMAKTAATFGVSESALKAWKLQLKQTGNLEKKTLQRTFKKIDPEKLQTYLTEHPDAFLKEIAQVFACTDVAVLKAMKRLGITRKKNHSISRNKQKCEG